MRPYQEQEQQCCHGMRVGTWSGHWLGLMSVAQALLNGCCQVRDLTWVCLCLCLCLSVSVHVHLHVHVPVFVLKWSKAIHSISMGCALV